jgi:hypothetical protein
VNSAQNGNAPAEDALPLCEADRTYLAGQLSPSVLSELVAILRILPPETGSRLIREVRMEAEAFGDNALLVALARLAHLADTRPLSAEGRR